MNKFINLITRISLTNSSKFFKADVKKQPKMRLRSIVPIFPPPGLNLKLPGIQYKNELFLILKYIIEWTPETFLWKIGNNCKEHADKFENLGEIFSSNRVKIAKI